ncbi:hypothetical protein DL764_006956 [Monosporascus ibericus]|uniref:Uncharacterized protein n=1 Tax=Monosporascus ibericus TaxID=155417 RepID=A0A4Q4T6L3_9PEZI|nr:hypothetical protein DL764_006956 [Monosporascus ibericus]
MSENIPTTTIPPITTNAADDPGEKVIPGTLAMVRQDRHRPIFDEEKLVFSMTLNKALLVVNSTGFKSEQLARFIERLGQQADLSGLFVDEENRGLWWPRYLALTAVAIRMLGMTPPDPFREEMLLPRLLYATTAVVNALRDGGDMQKDLNNGEHALPDEANSALPDPAKGRLGREDEAEMHDEEYVATDDASSCTLRDSSEDDDRPVKRRRNNGSGAGDRRGKSNAATQASDSDIAAMLSAAGDDDELSDCELARLQREVDVAGGFVLVSKKQLALYARRYHSYGGDVYDPDGAHGFALAAQLRRETRRLADARADLDRYVRTQSSGDGGGSSTATPNATTAAPSPLLSYSGNDNDRSRAKKGSRSGAAPLPRKTLLAATDVGRRREERESPDGPAAVANENQAYVEPSGGDGSAAGINADGSSCGSSSSGPEARPKPPRPYKIWKVSEISEQVGID